MDPLQHYRVTSVYFYHDGIYHHGLLELPVLFCMLLKAVSYIIGKE